MFCRRLDSLCPTIFWSTATPVLSSVPITRAMSPSSHQCQGWSSCAVSDCKPLACTDIAASWTSGQTHTVLGKDREHTGAKKDLGIHFWAIFVPYIVNSDQFLFLRLLEIFAFSLPACLAGQQLWVRLFLIHHSPLHLSSDPECITMAGWNFPATAWSGTPLAVQGLEA